MKKYLNIFLISLSVAVLFGCATKTPKIVFHPDLQLVGQQLSALPQALSIAVNIEDRRGISHIATVSGESENKQLIYATTPPVETISSQFTALLTALNIKASAKASKQLHLYIDMIDVRIRQSHVAHDASVQVQFTLAIKTSRNTFKKPFYGNMRIEGLLGYDIAVIEKELNLLVESLIHKMLSDQEVKTYLLEQ